MPLPPISTATLDLRPAGLTRPGWPGSARRSAADRACSRQPQRRVACPGRSRRCSRPRRPGRPGRRRACRSAARWPRPAAAGSRISTRLDQRDGDRPGRPGSAAVSANAAGPAADGHQRRRRTPISRGVSARARIAITRPVLAATSANVTSQTPPTAARARTAGCCHWLTPSTAHGPPKPCQDRSHSVVSQALGTSDQRRGRPGRAVTGGASVAQRGQPDAGPQGADHDRHQQQARAQVGRQPVHRGQQVARPEPPAARGRLAPRRRDRPSAAARARARTRPGTRGSRPGTRARAAPRPAARPTGRAAAGCPPASPPRSLVSSIVARRSGPPVRGRQSPAH